MWLGGVETNKCIEIPQSKSCYLSKSSGLKNVEAAYGPAPGTKDLAGQRETPGTSALALACCTRRLWRAESDTVLALAPRAAIGRQAELIDVTGG